MERLGVAVPILPGQFDRWREMVAELKRRDDEHQASMKAKGVDAEFVWLESTPAGEMVVVYQEGHDLQSYMRKVFESDEPFDRWFAEELRAVHGFDPEVPPPPLEQVF